LPIVCHFSDREMIVRFREQYPKIEVPLESTNRRVDVIREGFDLAIGVRFPPLEESNLIIRKFGDSPQCLVAVLKVPATSYGLISSYFIPSGMTDAGEQPHKNDFCCQVAAEIKIS
jgi:hypothetical protein